MDCKCLVRQAKVLHNLQIGTPSRQKSGDESGRVERSADRVIKAKETLLNAAVEVIL